MTEIGWGLAGAVLGVVFVVGVAWGVQTVRWWLEDRRELARRISREAAE